MNFNCGNRSAVALDRNPIHSSHAFTLIETLVYMGLLFLVLGMGYAAMYRSMDASTALRRNANDIVQALKLGEQWRDEVRTVTAPIRLDETEQQNTLHLPHGETEIEYRFASNSVSRRVGSEDWLVVLDHAKNSAFVSDRRDNVTAWRWEIELQPSRKRITRIKPLFTFVSAPPANFAQ